MPKRKIPRYRNELDPGNDKYGDDARHWWYFRLDDQINRGARGSRPLVIVDHMAFLGRQQHALGG